MGFERIQSLSEKELALGGPMNIAPRMSENTMSTDFHGIYELDGLALPPPFRTFWGVKGSNSFVRKPD
jgi:hypothetical protein